MAIKFFLALTFALSLLSGFGCQSKTVVKRLANQNSSGGLKKSETNRIDGVVYHLPQTVVQVTVPVNKLTQTPGAFQKFAPCFFSEAELKNLIKEKKIEFSIDPPNFDSRGIPDTSETFVIGTKGGYFESKTLFVEYAPDSYILQKGEAESKNETLEFTVKAIATAAGVASKLGPLMQSTRLNDKEKSELANKLREEYSCYETIIGGAARVAATEVFYGAKDDVETQFTALQQAQNPSPLGIQISAKQKFRDDYQKALATFEKFQELQRQRDEILNGGNNNNIPPDTLKMILEKNAESIAVYRAAFLGKETEKVWSATFEYTPAKNTSRQNSPMIFSYSKQKGVCRNGLIKEKSIPIAAGFENAKCGDSEERSAEVLWLQVNKSTDAVHNDFLTRIQNASNLSESHDKSRGWYYRVPADGTVALQNTQITCRQIAAGAAPKYNCSPLSIEITGANIKIKYPAGAEIIAALSEEQIGLGSMQIAQLGVVASVPARTAGRSNTTTVMLDPATGAMKNFKSSSTALVDKSILDDAGKAANSAIDAADPLNRKKRELEDKKIKNQINEQDRISSNSNSGDTDNR